MQYNMLTIAILYFLTRSLYSASQTATIGEHTPAFYDIEYARLGRIMKQYRADIQNLRDRHNHDKGLLELCQKYKSNEKTIASITETVKQSGAGLDRQLRAAMLTQGDIDKIKAAQRRNRASTAADFAYEMAYKNPVARIPAMISFMAKRMTRTK